jgi:Fur family ferric uptake transcriptional regulator
LLNEVYDLLRKNNIKITPHRKAVLQILNNCRGHHIGIENIHQLICFSKDKYKKIGIATVYRAVELFAKIGIVSKLQIENSSARYELLLPKESNHHHLICIKCGVVKELEHRHTDCLKETIYFAKNILHFHA